MSSNFGNNINPITCFEPPTNFNEYYGRYNNLFQPPEPRINQTWPVRLGEVEAVNWNDYTCSVSFEGGGREDRVRCMSPWFSCSHGSGINFCPESGSKVLVTKFKDKDWYILGFIPWEQRKEDREDSDTFFNNWKPDMNEGDIHLSTESGNFIFIQKSAHAIRIENTPACFIDMQSARNYIHIGCQNILLQTKAGMITMLSADPEVVQDEDGTSKAKPVDVCTTGFFRMNVGDYKNFVKVDIGKVRINNPGVADNTIFALNICDKLGILIDTDGNIKTYTAGTVTNLADKDITVATKAKVAVKAESNVGIDTGNNFVLKASGSIGLNAGNNVITQSGKDIKENASGSIINSAGAIDHNVGSGSPASPNTSAPYPSIPDNSNNVKNKPFTITHLI